MKLWLFLKNFGMVIFTPTEYSRIENNANYKEALNLVNQNLERLKATLTDEQKKSY